MKLEILNVILILIKIEYLFITCFLFKIMACHYCNHPHACADCFRNLFCAICIRHVDHCGPTHLHNNLFICQDCAPTLTRPIGFSMEISSSNQQLPDLINLLQNREVAWGDEILVSDHNDIFTIDNNGQIIEWVGAIFNDWVAWR